MEKFREEENQYLIKQILPKIKISLQNIDKISNRLYDQRDELLLHLNLNRITEIISKRLPETYFYLNVVLEMTVVEKHVNFISHEVQKKYYRTETIPFENFYIINDRDDLEELDTLLLMIAEEIATTLKAGDVLNELEKKDKGEFYCILSKIQFGLSKNEKIWILKINGYFSHVPIILFNQIK